MMIGLSGASGQTAYDALGRRKQPFEKPLPTPPSPTLTNPDLVLPDIASNTLHSLSYTPRHDRRIPTPNSLVPSVRHVHSSMSSTRGARSDQSGYDTRSLREKTSRLRLDRTSPNADRSRSDDSEGDASTERGSTISSNYSLVLQPTSSADRLDARSPAYKRGGNSSNAGSSPTSEDLAGVAHFLSKYKSGEAGGSGSEKDEENATAYGDDAASARHSISVSVIENGIEVQRRIQEEEEQTSAILSRRAEEILANAKRKLNLMEGNLRGARELVAPLTAANLKRAASLGSAYHTPFSNHTQFLYGTPASTQAPSEPGRASSAAAEHQGHWRNYSDVSLSGRSTSRTPSYARRIPVVVNDAPRATGLRGSKSYDALSATASPKLSTMPASTDSPLETLQEDEAVDHHARAHDHSFSGSESVAGLGISRDGATPDDIRSQMSSLKGRISALRQRAREDSCRRRSFQSLRSKSSMTSVSDEDRVYDSARASPVPSATSAMDWRHGSQTINGLGAQSWQQQNSPILGSRNAFAEQVARQSGTDYSSKALPPHPHAYTFEQSAVHRAVESWRVDPAMGMETPLTGTPSLGSDDILYEETEPESDAQSEDGTSVYEDAEMGLEDAPANNAIVPHEERIDAFDYQQFFLSSAVAAYENRRDSISSESSTSTAKRPASDRHDETEEFDINGYPPPIPQTPERLRAIERDLQHNRAPSAASMATMATFRTAREGREGRQPEWSTAMPTSSRPQTALDRPRTSHRQTDQLISRPHTVMEERRILHQRASSSLGRDSDSDRADSGIGLTKRSPNGMTKSGSVPRPDFAVRQRDTLPTPPMSPTDPVARAVNALLDPQGRRLGLKEKALLFGAVENLRRLALQLQSADEVSMPARVLRQKLDDARKVLEASSGEMQQS